MSRIIRQVSKRNLEEKALDYAISKLLNEDARESVLFYFEIRHVISLEREAPLTTKQVKKVLDNFFGDGSTLILDEFYKKLAELKSQE